jgi:2-desacetyl-2-hydroxyethyl bacteriochlorophyllide A dehydrogenase
MRAMVFRGVGKPLSLETVSDPTPSEQEVVLKVAKCGICGTDIHRTEQNVITMKAGTIPGHEFSGEVVALGKGVTSLKIGDRVTALPYLGCNQCVYCLRGSPLFCAKSRNVGNNLQQGAYAEYVVTGAPFTMKLPESLSLDDGALIEPLAVGLRGVLRAQLKPGQKVLVLGAGPIGLATAYWAKRAGAGKVAVQASSPRRKEMAHNMGADTFVLPEEGVPPAQSALAALGGAPDVVFECVGAVGMIDQAVATVRNQGVVVVLGVCSHHDQWLPVVGLIKEIDLRFSVVYDVSEYQACIDAMSAGDITPRAMITETVDLDHMADMFEALRNRTNQCKVLVAPWGK